MPSFFQLNTAFDLSVRNARRVLRSQLKGRFFAEIGVNYVSCSPYRIPVARLAAAQAAVMAAETRD